MSTAYLEALMTTVFYCFLADWLDNGNNKKALAESERVLKKQPDLTCAKVLMSLALLRMGRNAEAVALLDKVLAEKPTKDDVLQAMTIAFKELQQGERCEDFRCIMEVGSTWLFFYYSRQDMHYVRERCDHRAQKRRAAVPTVHVVRASGLLQETAVCGHAALQSESQESLLLLGCDVSATAGPGLSG